MNATFTGTGPTGSEEALHVMHEVSTQLVYNPTRAFQQQRKSGQATREVSPESRSQCLLHSSAIALPVFKLLSAVQ
jgi:hypothetical protein